MRRTLIVLAGVLMYFSGHSQANDKYVRLTGKTLSAKDSSAISVSILYEKLPYYDDMGVYKSTEDGNFEFYLINNDKYTFKITGTGFLEKNEEFDAKASADGSMVHNFYIAPADEPEVFKLEHLIFARGSETITESSYEELNQLVKYLGERPNTIIQLEGHTDFAGNAEANVNLSQARVDAVKEYLIKQGVKKTQVLTKAFGGTQPLYTERTEEAKTLNRRVEVRIIKR